MKRTKKIRNDMEAILNITSRLGIVDYERKSYRKIAARFLREYSDLISDKRIRSKIRGSYFKDLVDQRVIDTLQDVYKKL